MYRIALQYKTVNILDLDVLHLANLTECILHDQKLTTFSYDQSVDIAAHQFQYECLSNEVINYTNDVRLVNFVVVIQPSHHVDAEQMRRKKN